MGRFFIAALVMSLTGGLAWAQAPAMSLEAHRHTYRQALAEQSRLARERSALEVAFQTVSSAIAARKALGQVVADDTLEGLLRRHRELAARLTQLSRGARAAAQTVRRATRDLVKGIDQRVAALRVPARGKSVRARAAGAEVRRLLSLRNRLTGVRPGRVGGCPLPDIRITSADGPQEALAKANLLRDAEERCRRRITGIERRLASLKNERQLLQEASDFREESSLFDEESRRRLQTRVQAAAATGGSRGSTGAAPAANPPAGEGNSAGGTDTDPQAGMGGAPSGDFTLSGVGASSVPPGSAAGLSVRGFRQVDPSLGSGRYESAEDEIAGLTRLRLNLRRAAERIARERRSLSRRAKAIEKRP